MKRGGNISRLRPELAEKHMKQEGPKPRVCRRKKQEWINNKIKHIEELNDKKET